MEGISVNAYKGIKRYWKRKGYQRLNTTSSSRDTTTTTTTTGSLYRPYRKVRVQLSRFNLPQSEQTTTAAAAAAAAPLPTQHPTPTPTLTTSAAPSHRRRRFWRWRVRIAPKIRIISPRKWLTRLRDAYVNIMLKFANSAVFRGGYGGSLGFGGGGGFPIKEYDERVLVEFYKSVLMAQAGGGGGGQVVGARDVGKLGSAAKLVVAAVGR